MRPRAFWLACLLMPLALRAQSEGPSSVQPDLTLTRLGIVAEGRPAQMVFGPDGRLYVSLASFGSATAPSVVSFAYDPTGSLSDARVAARTGGALGIGFGAVSLGPAGSSRVTTGMYLTDAARGGVSHLRVLTPGDDGMWGTAGGINTAIVRNIPGGYHQADQIVVDGTTLYVGMGVRTSDGVAGYPRPTSGKENAYGGTISTIANLTLVNGLEPDSAGFGLTGDARDNQQPDFSNGLPFTSTDPAKLVVHSAGARNPFGLSLDGNGDLWFTNNFATVESDGTFDGTLDPLTHLLKGFDTGDLDLPDPDAPDLTTHVHDQFFKAVARGDYGYNNVNWRTDAARRNPRVTSLAAMDAGFFDVARHGVRSVTFDNLTPGRRGFSMYDQQDGEHLVGLGPGSSATGFAFYTGRLLPARYHGQAFITRWNGTTRDSTGHAVSYRDLVAVDPATGLARVVAKGFGSPIDAIEDGHGSLLVADHGTRAIYRIGPAGR